ncbi:MAG: bifunctional [glutamine synthetase] adenylyltransferase/[glutamine synthetase]-adenylyl-L-tyrosine phosphorylase [Hyphomicrobiales bacterium]|nr:bifunctional [glutamine synthetase] adenylyltransferase/[glutamine synthetase]-adenylyl-L-tyrosine phosphorylase [Hyphomicrobiales bacterium]
MTGDDRHSLADRIVSAPAVHDAGLAGREWAELEAYVSGLDVAQRDAAMALLALPRVRALLEGTLGASSYLGSLVRRRPQAALEILRSDPDVHAAHLAATLRATAEAAETQPEVMRVLRTYKADIALLVALADLAGVWPVMTVTRVLSEAADTAVSVAVRHLFREAARRGTWLDVAADPETRSGYMVLAMGKHGAFELNYSSDIDLIVFYDPDRARVPDPTEVQTFFVRLTRDLVRLMQDRTEDGYVFRTDLRLRPDPGATPVAMSVEAALRYYESFGQNWERAALIKARAIAGDIAAGQRMIADLAPFVWRKYLDFAAIADIHAMKRQIHAARGFGAIAVAGHNIKLGRGGIREIEFFAQTQQLIAGGRQSDLRVSQTLLALQRLAARQWIEPSVAKELTGAYETLRTVEHRLQMVADEQTQTLPSEPDALLRVARLSGHDTIAAFETRLRATLQVVQRHYARLFEESPALTAGGANMVFAGEADDPSTIEALTRLGFKEPARTVAAVRGWHHGRYAAIRTPRARELLTEVQPLLIEALAKTADPDQALIGFDRFLSELPSGVQLFSLLKQQPGLIDLVAAIMGSAPRLARVLSRQRRALDAVLDPGFFGTLASLQALQSIVDAELAEAPDLQTALDRARVVGHEQAFLIGVRVLTGTISAESAGGAYAALADSLIRAMLARVTAHMEQAHGRVPGGAAAVIAMGKLGGREMTAASDLDLILVYDFDAEAQASDGPRPLAPAQYYARLTQRLISAITAQTAEGALYEVDMRLRPSGQKGPVATQLSSFIEYQASEAWTWEHMALTRARVVCGPPALTAKVEAAIANTLVRPRDRARIATDVREMRARIAAEKGAIDIWDLKQVRGGLVDIEFIAQHLQLVCAAECPQILDQNTERALAKLAAAGCLDAAIADRLIATVRLEHSLTQVLRLCLDGSFDPAKAPDGLTHLLARAANAPDLATLTADLKARLTDAAELFDQLIA